MSGDDIEKYIRERTGENRVLAGDTADCMVIGIGSFLMGDDGIGVHAARVLKEMVPEDVEVVEGGVYSADMLAYIGGCKTVIFIDAMDSGLEPGTVYRFTPEEVKNESGIQMSIHDFGLYDLIRSARLMDLCPEKIILFAVQVKEVSLGIGLSEELERVLPELCRLVIKELSGVVNGIQED
jgi:hydrogenase maturation protease